MEPPKRQLSLFDLLCLGVNAIVGSGIYAFPGLLAQLLGPGAVLAFAGCGVVSLLIGLCFAEAAGLFDRSGGPTVYARAAFGPLVGYLVGWTCWAAAVLSWAAVTRALVPYLAELVPSLRHPALGAIGAAAVTLALGAINYLGVKPGAYAMELLTVAKLVPLGVLAALGLVRAERQRLRPFLPHGLRPLPRGIFLVFFAFQGFEVVPVPAGETARPRRYAPIAVLGSLALATALYMAIQLAASGTTENLAGSKEPLALMGRALLGTVGGQMVSAAAVVSMLGFCAGVALASPRYLEALATDGHLPTALCARHPRHGTPHRAILVTSGVVALLVLFLDFARLVDLSVLTVGVQYLATCAAVPMLRKRLPSQPRAFHLPGGATIPLLATIVLVSLFGLQLTQTDGGLRIVLSFCGIVALGGIPWLLFRKKPPGGPDAPPR
ncbi:MAG: amino acid permease [Deltaproteobacteria bacterium]|nr:amino acid permease [Deltaproteobacteria bacterium]